MRPIKTITITVLSLFLLATHTCGQTPKIDSLEALLQTHTRVDTAKVNLLNTIAYEIFRLNPSKAKTLAQDSWELSSQLNYTKGKAASLWISGLISLKNDKKKSLEYFQKALKIAEEIDDKVGICNYQTAIGNVAKDFGDIDTSNKALEKALEIALQLEDNALICKCRLNISTNMNISGRTVEAAQQLQEVITLAEQLGDQRILAQTYCKLASIYRVQGNPSMALEYYLSALQLDEKREDKTRVIANLINIAGIQSDQKESTAALETIHKALKLSTENRDSMQMSICYTNIGNIYQRMKNPKALDYFQQARILSKDMDIGQTINNLTNIGSIYTEQGEFEKAALSFNEAQDLAQKREMKRLLGEVQQKMSALYFKQGNYRMAIEYTKKALNLATPINYIDLQKECYKQLADIYAAMGNFKEAYSNYVQYKSLYDFLFNEKATRQIALLESSYQFAKEKEVYKIEKSSRELKIKSQHQIILSLIVVSILIILLAVALYWSERLRKRVLKLKIENINRELEANQKAMAVAKLKLVQNAERDLHNVKMLEDIGNNTMGEGKNNVNSLISNYKLQANHSNWEEFETLFTKIHKPFWDELNDINPTLTPNERKLCAFLKLNMNNKDIALITFQSEEALKKSRLRLRKKLNLDRSINLTSFIQNIAS